MTVAICNKCGAEKYGALTKCSYCGSTPSTDDDITESIIFSTNYLSREQLSSISHAIKSGKPPNIDEASFNLLKDKLQRSNSKFRKRAGIFSKLFSGSKD